MALQLSNYAIDKLIEDTASGNTYAFEQLYNATSTAVFSYALSVLKNRFDAEDVLHDCFVRIYGSADDYKAKGKPMAWILTITRNLCYKHLQQQSRYAALTDNYFNSGIMEDTDDKLIIKACMEKLSDEERQIVVLHAVAGMKHREIAAFMDLPLSTVLSKYRRTIQKIRSSL